MEYGCLMGRGLGRTNGGNLIDFLGMELKKYVLLEK
jgi:hypothetical protein